MNKQPSIMIMAGGTGGHIYPALALLKKLKASGWQVHWLGAKAGLEEQLLSTESVQLHLLPVKGLRGNGLRGWLKAPWVLCRCVWRARKILRQCECQLAVGFGGFASGPGGLACVLSRVPLFLHEQNAVAGMTNRILARFAQKVFAAFPQSFARWPYIQKKVQVIGNPVRADILALEKVAPEETRATRLLIVGGSRGALAINESLPSIISELIEAQKLQVWHQTGAGKLRSTKDCYAQALNLDREQLEKISDLKISEYIEDMASAYQWADLVICRAGALTVSEIAAVGMAAIFVPLPIAVDDHQTANAMWLVNANAAQIIKQSELTTTGKKVIASWCTKSPQELFAIGQRARKIAYVDATEHLALACEKLREAA